MVTQLFSIIVREECFRRSRGRCECTDSHPDQVAPHHGGRCPNMFIFTRPPDWDCQRTDPAGPPVLSNMKALCIPCSEAIPT